ncbi:MAG: ATP-binding protein, partial [Spirochaetota bacterium]
GLYLSQIGINWEVYINGKLLKREVHLSDDGSIKLDRSLGMTLIAVDVRSLHAGENTLAFKIIGDPAFKLTGFYRDEGYLFGSYDRLDDSFGKMQQGFLIFFYLILALFVLVIFAGSRAEKYVLFYGLTTFQLALYIFARSPFSYMLITDSAQVVTLEFVSIFLIMPFIGAMFDHLVLQRISLFTKIYGSFHILCAAALLATPVMVDFDILLVWQISTSVPILYYPVMIFVKGVLPDYREAAAHTEFKSSFFERALFFCRVMVTSYSGLIFIGFVVMESCAAIDIIAAVLFANGQILTQYGVFAFILSVGIIIAVKYSTMHRDLENLNIELKEKILTINDANSRLTLSEEKYRFLVDYSADYIFILNTDGTFLSASNALLKSMKIRQDEIGRHSFFDLLYTDEKERGIDIDLIRSSFSEMVENKTKTRFKAKFRSSGVINDPKDFNVFLDCVSIDGRDLILGKAVHAGEDTLQEFYLSERQKYRINNYLFSAEQMSRRIAGHAEKFLTESDANTLRISIREMLINAIEHGNLSVTYEEKTEAMMQDHYFEFIKERQNDPAYRDRRVEVDFLINESKIVCRITDEGKGFDHRKMMADRAAKANDEMLSHGRGLQMADNFFDKISFNEKGNQILVVKHLAESDGQ